MHASSTLVATAAAFLGSGLVLPAGPWPATGAQVEGAAPTLLRIRPRTPLLEGPDALEPAPFLVLTADFARLNAERVGPPELEQVLRTLKKAFEILQPGVAFNGVIDVACAPDTPTTRLGEYLARARAVGYPNVSFAFVHESPSADSAANATTEPRAQGRPIRLRDHRDCQSLATAVVVERRQKRTVRLVLEGAAASPGLKRADADALIRRAGRSRRLPRRA